MFLSEDVFHKECDVELLGIRKDPSEAVIFLPQRILVLVTGLLGDSFCVMRDKTGRVPFLHLNHGVVVVRQRLFGVNRVHPFVDSLPVIAQKLVEINVSMCSESMAPSPRRQWTNIRFTKD